MTVLKALFCGQAKLVKELGASKVIIELADEMSGLSWDCKLLSPADLDIDTQSTNSSTRYADRLHAFLKQNSERYDVIDFDHEYLPFPRTDFCANTLMVARSVLLVQHLDKITIPHGRSIRSVVGHALKAKQRRQEALDRVCDANTTVLNADLVNVSNYDDKTELISRGVNADQIAVIPYGLSRSRIPLFDAISSDIPKSAPIVAFVGTFDYRKGAREFADIVHSVVQRVPRTRFRLLGCKGMMKSEADVQACFPERLHPFLDIKMTFPSDELPSLLTPCWVGLFPTYMEGMPFGILEMSAASLPVISYQSPGPSMILADSSLVAPGDWKSLTDRLVELLKDQEKLQSARIDAKERVKQFTWARSAEQTDQLYRKLLEEKRAGASHCVGNAS